MNDPLLLVEVRNLLFPSFITISTVYRQNVLPRRVCCCSVCVCVLTWASVSLRSVRVCSYLGAGVDGGAVMFKNITSYLGKCVSAFVLTCGVYACTCVCVPASMYVSLPLRWREVCVCVFVCVFSVCAFPCMFVRMCLLVVHAFALGTWALELLWVTGATGLLL